MKKDIIQRILEEGRHTVECESTLRETARYIGVSKSTVHKDVTERLKIIDPVLYSEVQAVIKKNKSERHIRGGEATKIRYLFYKKTLENTQK